MFLVLLTCCSNQGVSLDVTVDVNGNSLLLGSHGIIPKNRIVDSALIRESTSRRKPVYWHSNCEKSIKENIRRSSKLCNVCSKFSNLCKWKLYKCVFSVILILEKIHKWLPWKLSIFQDPQPPVYQRPNIFHLLDLRRQILSDSSPLQTHTHTPLPTNCVTTTATPKWTN